MSILCPEFSAQTTGEITGAVTDSSGGSVANATVSIRHHSNGAIRVAATNDAGIYRVASLQPGTYELKIEKEGFRPVVWNLLEVAVQDTVRIDVQLQIGAVSEAVTVESAFTSLNTENATIGGVIDNRRIRELPLNGRNFLQLVSLNPHVSFGFNHSLPTGAAGRQGGSRAEQHISIAGEREAFNRYTLDGIENTDVNFNTYIVLPSIDVLQEFKVQSGVYPAEFGRASGQINVATKSGGNHLHGALFEFLRNDKLDSKTYAFTVSRPGKEPFKWNQYGYALSGPVWIPKLFDGRNRLFFLSNFEGYRDRKQLRGIFNVPSVAMREGDFSELARQTVIYDPLTRTRQEDGRIVATPFAGNLAPPNRIHPTSAQLLEFYPMPNVATGSLSSNFQTGLNRRIDKDQFLQRIDLVQNRSSHWFGRYSWGDESNQLPNLKDNGSKVLTRVHQAMVSHTGVLSPAAVNEMRFGYTKFFNSFGHELAFVRDVVSELSIPGVPLLPAIAWGIPEIRVAGFGYFGNLAEGPYVNDNNILQWRDDFSWVRGRHSFRFGAEVRRDGYNHSGNSGVQGRFAFDGLATRNPLSSGGGAGFADYLLGLISGSQGALGLAVAQFRSVAQSYYIDDSWKLTSNLTLSLGLRYENTPPWLDRSGTQINAHIPFVDTQANVSDLNRHPTLIRIGAGDFYEGTILRFDPSIRVARDGRLGERLIAGDNNDFAPRIGVAWSPTASWTLRAGAGIFYSQDTANPRFDMNRNLGGRRNDLANADFPDLSWERPFLGLGSELTIATPFVLANVHQRRTPYSMHYLLNVQRALGRNTMAEAGYLGSTSLKLESLRFFNEPLPSPSGTAQSRAPYRELGLIQTLDGGGKGRYDSLGVKLHRRTSRGLTALIGYTWSKSIDTTSAIRVHIGEALFPQNSYCMSCERALSSFHVSHRWVSSAMYELPFGKHPGIFGHFSRGWQVATIVTLQSGFPFTVSPGAQRSNTSPNIKDRTNVTGAEVALPRGRQDPERFFNTAAFVPQPFGTYGNAGRNAVIGPGLISWDSSVMKNFSIKEGHQLQFRFEAFNVANHPNWDTPGLNLDRPDFGKIRSTRTPMRELQVALKYIF
jgi:hypothetical protein